MSRRPINVLVVEDEILLLRNIKKKILAVSEDFQVIGEVFNGKEALEVIEKNRPDIVFTDIRMPIMDGLELAKILQEKYPEIYVIIVSGYDDFDYARTAIRYQVCDYLLKPLKMDALTELLNSLKSKIRDNCKIKTYSSLTEILSGENHSDFSSEEMVYLEDKAYSCFLVCFGNLHTHCEAALQKSDFPQTFDDISWYPLFEEAPFPVSNFWVFPQQFRNIKLILTVSPAADPVEMGAYLHRCLTEKMPDTPIHTVCSSVPVSLSQLHTERIQLRRQLFARLTIGRSQQLILNSAAQPLPPAILPNASVTYLQSLVETGSATGFAEAIRQLFAEWTETSAPQQWIEKILLQIFHILQRSLYFSDEDYEKMQSSVFYSLETKASLSESMEPVIYELVYWITLNRSTPTEIEAVIEEMNTYIRFHYKEAINISELADKYHFNHSHLTRMFKKQKGQPPLKLINELRIEDAKKLLTDSQLSIREISEQLGFTDQHYFSRIFKKSTGTNPKEYRTNGAE